MDSLGIHVNADDERQSKVSLYSDFQEVTQNNDGIGTQSSSLKVFRTYL
jgi:hypothetical protein